MQTHQKSSQPVATIGLDIGKTTFHLVGLDKRGAIAMRRTAGPYILAQGRSLRHRSDSVRFVKGLLPCRRGDHPVALQCQLSAKNSVSGYFFPLSS